MRSIHVAIAVGLLLSTGCAFGNKLSYTGVSNFTAPIPAGHKIAVMMHDQRYEVLSGSHSREWVGCLRSLNGIPYGVHTQTGNPLADDFGSIVTDTLKNKGIDATQVKTDVLTPPDAAKQQLFSAAPDSDRAYIQLKHWETDTYMRPTLEYEVALSLIDKEGKTVAEEQTSGEKKLTSGNPGFETLANGVTTIFTDLFNRPSMQQHFSSLPSSNANPIIGSQPLPALSKGGNDDDDTGRRLKLLKSLKDSGAITAEEYSSKRKSIVDSL